MKNFLLVLVVIMLCLASCSYGKPLKQSESDNNFTYEVSYLFTHEGCSVYRFYDLGHYVYFTKCAGEVSAVTDSTRVVNRTVIQH